MQKYHDEPKQYKGYLTLHGPYCSACGQREGDLHRSVSHFVHEALDGLFSFDSRVWQTIALLLRRPGFLTREYWEGRRTRYLAPVRVYFFVSFFTFLVQGLLPVDAVVDPDADGASPAPVQVPSSQIEDDAVDWDEDFEDAPPALRWMALNLLRPAVEEPDRMRTLFVRRLPWAVFLLVPLFATTLRLLYRRTEAYFVPHLVFALHFHTAAFLLLTAGALGDVLTGREFPGSVAAVAILVLLFLSLRHAYGNGRLRTLVKQMTLLSVHFFAAAVTLFLLFGFTGLSI